MSKTEIAAEAFEWGELGEAWWLDAGKTTGATERQIKFACAKNRGCSNTESARQAGYVDNDESIRQQAYRTFRTTVVQSLLALAVTEGKGGDDGTVDRSETRRILSKLARGSDPSVKIRALEAISKLDERVGEEERLRREAGFGSAEDTLRELCSLGLAGTICAALCVEKHNAFSFSFDPLETLTESTRRELSEVMQAVVAKLEPRSMNGVESTADARG